jgi:serine/threonine protein kinase
MTEKVGQILKGNVVEYIDYYIDEYGDDIGKIKTDIDGSFVKNGKSIKVMGLRYIDGVELGDFIKRYRDRKGSFKIFLDIAIQILNIFSIMHKNGIYHRDIKKSNIMIRYKRDEVDDDDLCGFFDTSSIRDVEVVIIDFGFSVDVNYMRQEIKNCTSIRMGTNGYFHKEILHGVNKTFFVSEEFLRCADTFAIGVTLFLLFNGCESYPYDNELNKVCDSNCENFMVDAIIESMINPEEIRRLSIDNALTFFKDM